MTDLPQVFVDFNECYRDVLYACYPEHVKGQEQLVIGQKVLLTDDEADYMEGKVLRFENYGRGDLVVMSYDSGSWRVDKEEYERRFGSGSGIHDGPA